LKELYLQGKVEAFLEALKEIDDTDNVEVKVLKLLAKALKPKEIEKEELLQEAKELESEILSFYDEIQGLSPLATAQERNDKINSHPELDSESQKTTVTLNSIQSPKKEILGLSSRATTRGRNDVGKSQNDKINSHPELDSGSNLLPRATTQEENDNIQGLDDILNLKLSLTLDLSIFF